MHVAASLYVAAMQTEGISLVNAKEADVVINIDSIHNSGMVRGKKTVYWELDDNMHQGRNSEYYDVDLLYIVTKDRLKQYPAHAKWLPVAMEPTIHYPWGFAKEYDLVFIGSEDPIPEYLYRREVLNTLTMSFVLKRGTCQPQNYPKELSRGKLLVNVMPQKKDQTPLINTRIYESMGIGCLLNDYHPSLDDLFIRDRHYIAYESAQDAVDKARFYLDHQYRRDQVEREGRMHVLNNHTWKHRLFTIMKDIEKL